MSLVVVGFHLCGWLITTGKTMCHVCMIWAKKKNQNGRTFTKFEFKFVDALPQKCPILKEMKRADLF